MRSGKIVEITPVCAADVPDIDEDNDDERERRGEPWYTGPNRKGEP